MTITHDIILVLQIISIIILANGAFQNSIHLFELIVAFTSLRNRFVPSNEEEAWWTLSESTMPISIIMPAYNEEKGIIDSVKSMLALHYPSFEVIVVNDGSRDTTLQLLINEFSLSRTLVAHEGCLEHRSIRAFYKNERFSRLLVVDKENGGKADAINAGIEVARYPLFCVVDSDSILESDSLLRVVQPFTDNPDKVVAVGGCIRIANGSEIVNGRIKKIGLPGNLLALFQIIEYLRAFLIARLAMSRIHSTVLISGAFGIYKRSIAMQIGGFTHGTVGEDMDIIMKLHRFLHDEKKEYEMIFTPEPVCWTECPSDLKSLKSQRARWQQGALEVFFRHKVMFGNYRYGFAGLIGFPYIFSSDVIGPLIEFAGYIIVPTLWLTGFLDFSYMLAFLAFTITFGIFFSVGSLILSEMELRNYKKPSHLLALFVVAILENFGYRQLNNYWRLVGWLRFILKRKGWGNITRKGLSH
jgi:cellulose synthase/poly-beta-1,6-N-acetylglucosamine synthase-like glycosyltransferase